MKVDVYTKHTLSMDEDESGMFLEVDGDHTVKISLPTSSGDSVESRWLYRDDLETLRALINKALTLIP